MTREDGPSADESERAEALRSELAGWAGVPRKEVRLVRSPYRVCPLGAHVDHQLGEVTGMALDRALLLAFCPGRDRIVRARSRQFQGTVEVDLDAVAPAPRGDWADYLRGAAIALARTQRLERGLWAIVAGHDNVGGLSSSAAAGVAYLLALEAANGIELSAEDNIELDRIVENDYIGLNNGILDQASILLGSAGRLMHLDCRNGTTALIPFGGEASICVAVLFSGLRKALLDSDYNRRVAECRAAAEGLLQAADLCVRDEPVLGRVPREVYECHGDRLPVPLRRRAVHFFTEQRRVREGVQLWRKGDLAGFGELVTASGRSSVENYECGNRYLRTAYEVLRSCPGIYGARFSGGGFRGCCIGLARPEMQDQIAGQALSGYLAVHPDMEGEAEVYFCRSADGAALMEPTQP